MTSSEPDFGGRIGRTIADSEAWWPDPKRPPGDAPNVVMIVLDDTGFAHFGCYGSTIETPSIDRLAEEGVRYSNFHTTALCSPSRACLLTGRNHHSVGMRAVSNFDSGFPNMRGGITPRAATIAELLQANGYATFSAGKWHLAPMQDCSAAGPFDNWPLQKGFDRFYGFLQGETDQFYPELTEDNHHISPPALPEDGYHVSEDLIDQSMNWIRDIKSVRPDKPFFLYVAFGATHAPHQAPPEYLAKYRGRFDVGWDAAREDWFARQLKMGLVPESTTLADRNPGVLPWDELPENGRLFAARLQEAFAGFLEHTDAQIGRLIQFLEAQELLDDTLFIVLSDNGASQEGGPRGVMDEFSTFNLIREDLDDIVANRLDDIGTARAHSNIPWGWAQAGNTPLKWYKQNTYGGGVRDPLIIHWPKRITETGIRHQFCHVTDITPTVLDVTGVSVPETFNGHPQIPLHGTSLAYTWDEPESATQRGSQYFEQFGHRGIWKDGWKAVTYHRKGDDFDTEEWSLYNLDEDFSECHDLATEQPEKLKEMVDAWWAEAEQYDVQPLDDRTIELFGGTPRPGTPHGRDEYVYYHPMSHVPADAAPRLGGRAWTISADVTVQEGGCEGVLYARGSHNGGHTFFIKDGMVQFDYNALGEHFRAAGLAELSPGRHVIETKFTRDGQTGRLVVAVDGAEVGATEVTKIVRMLSSTGVDIGADRLSTVVDDYKGPFAFTGELHKVTFHMLSRAEQQDIETLARTELAKE